MLQINLPDVAKPNVIKWQTTVSKVGGIQLYPGFNTMIPSITK